MTRFTNSRLYEWGEQPEYDTRKRDASCWALRLCYESHHAGPRHQSPVLCHIRFRGGAKWERSPVTIISLFTITPWHEGEGRGGVIPVEWPRDTHRMPSRDARQRARSSLLKSQHLLFIAGDVLITHCNTAGCLAVGYRGVSKHSTTRHILPAFAPVILASSFTREKHKCGVCFPYCFDLPIIYGNRFINSFTYDTFCSPFHLLRQTVTMLTLKFLSSEIFFCGVPVRTSEWCLRLARFCSLVGPR